MRLSYSSEEKILGKWVYTGFSFRTWSVGISVSRHQICVDLLFFYLSIEL